MPVPDFNLDGDRGYGYLCWRQAQRSGARLPESDRGRGKPGRGHRAQLHPLRRRCPTRPPPRSGSTSRRSAARAKESQADAEAQRSTRCSRRPRPPAARLHRELVPVHALVRRRRRLATHALPRVLALAGPARGAARQPRHAHARADGGRDLPLHRHRPQPRRPAGAVREGRVLPRRSVARLGHARLDEARRGRRPRAGARRERGVAGLHDPADAERASLPVRARVLVLAARPPDRRLRAEPADRPARSAAQPQHRRAGLGAQPQLDPSPQRGGAAGDRAHDGAGDACAAGGVGDGPDARRRNTVAEVAGAAQDRVRGREGPRRRDAPDGARPRAAQPGPRGGADRAPSWT